MGRITVMVVVLGVLMISGLIWFWYYGTSYENRQSTYQWDFDPGTCAPDTGPPKLHLPPSPSPSCQEEDLTKQRVCCDGSKTIPELQCQVKIMSRRSPPRTACSVFSNPYSLPNLASFYLGARASVSKNTTTYIPSKSSCNSAWCLPSANTIIQPGLLIVGKNYRFQGNQGSILIELPEPAFISGFTLIHPRKCEIPNGYYSSTPKSFVVYGWQGVDTYPLELGRYMYKEGQSRSQSFPVQSNCIGSEMHKLLLVSFEENYGNRNYTSIYKFEVHGLFADNIGQEKSCSECA